MVRLVGDQEVEVTAQHASSTSAAVTVRIGRALRYLNDQATAAHFHKMWFEATAHARTLPPVGNPRTATWSGSWGHARTRHRRQRDRPPALQRRDGQRRPAGRQTVPTGPRGATRAARDLQEGHPSCWACRRGHRADRREGRRRALGLRITRRLGVSSAWLSRPTALRGGRVAAGRDALGTGRSAVAESGGAGWGGQVRSWLRSPAITMFSPSSSSVALS